MRREALVSAIVLMGLLGQAELRAEARWSVYVYMNAQPDLDEHALRDLEEMRLAGSSPDVRVYVQLAFSDLQVRRYRIEHGEARLVDELGAIDPMDWRNLVDFVAWGQARSKAERTCIVVWGHGTAPGEAGPGSGRLRGGIELAPAGMRLSGLRDSALRIRELLGRPADVWGFDSCFMQRIEVGYELRAAGGYLVASQDTLDGDGWDYLAWLGLLLDSPGMDAAELALGITRLSARTFGGEARPIACVDLGALLSLATAVGDLAVQLAAYATDRGRQAALVTAHYRARRYVGEAGGYVDLVDLAQAFTTGEFPEPLSAAARRVERAVGRAVLLRYGDERSSGISIYHQVRQALAASYLALDFARDTSWGDYLSGRPVPPRRRPRGRIYGARVRSPIPDASVAGTGSSLLVDSPGSVSAVRLYLHVRHDYVGDLQVTLASPGGRQVMVLDRAGGNRRNVRGWIASKPLTERLRGESALGEWHLHVADLAAGDEGELMAWRLELTLVDAPERAGRAPGA
jgi:hypothetical protein